MYRVYTVDYPQDDDPTYDELADAEMYAITLSYNDNVIAVADTEDDEIMLLVYQQTTYRP